MQNNIINKNVKFVHSKVRNKKGNGQCINASGSNVIYKVKCNEKNRLNYRSLSSNATKCLKNSRRDELLIYPSGFKVLLKIARTLKERFVEIINNIKIHPL